MEQEADVCRKRLACYYLLLFKIRFVCVLCVVCCAYVCVHVHVCTCICVCSCVCVSLPAMCEVHVVVVWVDPLNHDHADNHTCVPREGLAAKMRKSLWMVQL